MPWIKLESGRALNKKLRLAGFAARGLEEAVMCQMATDGVTITRGLAGRIGARNRRGDAFVDTETVWMVSAAHQEAEPQLLVDRLVDQRRWEISEGGWWVLGYLEFNYTKAEWEDLIEKKASGGRTSRLSPGDITPVATGVDTGAGRHVAQMLEPSSLSLSVEDKSSTSPDPWPGKKRPATIIADDFAVSAEMTSWALNRKYGYLDLDIQTELFVNHAHQNDRKCVNWVAAWRNWIIKAGERTPEPEAKSQFTALRGIVGGL